MMKKIDWLGILLLGIGFGGIGLPILAWLWVLCCLFGLIILVARWSRL